MMLQSLTEKIQLLILNLISEHGYRNLALFLDTRFLGKLIECKFLQNSLTAILDFLEVFIRTLISFIKSKGIRELRLITSEATLREIATILLQMDHRIVRREVLNLFRYISRKYYAHFGFELCNLELDFEYPDTKNCNKVAKDRADSAIFACCIRTYREFIRIVLTCDDLAYCIRDYKNWKKADKFCLLNYFCPDC